MSTPDSETGKEQAKTIDFTKRDVMMYFPAVFLYAFAALLSVVASGLGLIGSRTHGVILVVSALVTLAATEIAWRFYRLRFDPYISLWIMPDSNQHKKRFAENIAVYEEARRNLRKLN